MGIEKLWTKTPAERKRDPEILAALAEEKRKTLESLHRLGDQTKATCAGVLNNTFVRPFVRVQENGRKEFAPAKQMIYGAADSTGETIKLVGRVLMTTGRATKYGIRQGLTI